MVADLLRVSVLAGGRRADLAVPAGLPVAELLPLVADTLGGVVQDPARPHRLVGADGRPLDVETGLSAQGVRPGAVLVLAVDALPAVVHDDPAEALGAVVGAVPGWSAGQRTAARTGGAVVATVLAATGLLRHPEPAAAGLVGATASVALIAVAAWTSRSGRPGGPTAALLACLLAATSVVVVAPAPSTAPSTGPASEVGAWLAAVGPVTGAALVAGGLAGVVTLGRRRPLLLSPVLLGLGLLALGLVGRSPVEPAPVVAGLVTALVCLGGAVPGAVLGVVGRGAPPLLDPYDGAGPGAPRDPGPVDPDQLSRDVGLAADLLLGVTGGVGLLLVAATPLLALEGRASAALAGVLALHLVLRARRSRSVPLAAVDLGAGALGLGLVVTLLLLTDPAAGRLLVPVLALGGPLLLLGGLAPSVRLRRLGDLLETATLVALLPLLVVASGVLALVGG